MLSALCLAFSALCVAFLARCLFHFETPKILRQSPGLVCDPESFIALESAELVKERQESSINISWDDVRVAAVAECPEYQFGAAAAFGTCRS